MPKSSRNDPQRSAPARRDPAMGNLGYARIDADYYPTPSWCTHVLLRCVPLRGVMWEPACGAGHIAKIVAEDPDYGRPVIGTDLHDRGFGTPGRDFLTETAVPAGVEAIITNPPYVLAEEFVRHALRLTEPAGGQVGMLLRHEYDTAASRTDLFEHPAFAMKITLTKRPRWIEDSVGSPRHPYAWFVWDWQSIDTPPIIRWGQ